MAITQDVIVINRGLEERRRTTGSGTKSRYTLSIESEPIIHNFSEIRLGAAPAEAIKLAIQQQIKSITEVAAPATILRRQRAARNLAGGQAEEYKAMAKTAFGKKEIAAGRGHLLGSNGQNDLKRYSGGRIGFMPPSGSVRLFNDSGRLADGLYVMQNVKEKNWTINVPANRLDPTTFGDMAAFVRMVDRLRELVPALTKPQDVPAVRVAIQQSVGVMIQKARDQAEAERMAKAIAFIAALLT